MLVVPICLTNFQARLYSLRRAGHGDEVIFLLTSVLARVWLTTSIKSFDAISTSTNNLSLFSNGSQNWIRVSIFEAFRSNIYTKNYIRKLHFFFIRWKEYLKEIFFESSDDFCSLKMGLMLWDKELSYSQIFFDVLLLSEEDLEIRTRERISEVRSNKSSKTFSLNMRLSGSLKGLYEKSKIHFSKTSVLYTESVDLSDLSTCYKILHCTDIGPGKTTMMPRGCKIILAAYKFSNNWLLKIIMTLLDLILD